MGGLFGSTAMPVKSSAYLRHAAECLHYGKPVTGDQPDRWAEWLAFTLPETPYESSVASECRVLRFLLAADIAESEGD